MTPTGRQQEGREPILLTPAEAADRLGMKESRVRQLAQAGRLPHRRDGRFLRFTEHDLAVYVESIRVGSTNPYLTTKAARVSRPR